MGIHLWTRHVNEELHDTQPSCMWGLVHILDYHHWRSNVRKTIHHREFHGKRNPDMKELLDVTEINQDGHNNKTSPSSKRRSLKTRIKALVAEDFYKEIPNRQTKQGFGSKSSLQRTYSSHHLESLDAEIGKICTDWNHKVIFIPENDDNRAPQSMDKTQTEAVLEKTDDILEMLKIDKELFMRQLQDSDERIVDFSGGLSGMNTKPKLNKSRSFPVAELSQSKRLKPSKLENKQKEFWASRKEDNSHPAHIMKSSHRRSSSLNESLEKYVRFFDSSSGKETKLHPSKSLKLENEYGRGPLSLRRISSLFGDSYYSALNFSVVGDDFAARDGSSDVHTRREEVNIVLPQENDQSEKVENGEQYVPELKRSDSCRDEHSILDSETYKQEMAPHVEEFQFSQGSGNRCSQSHELSSSVNSNDETPFFASFHHEGYQKNNTWDLQYVRQLLEQSGIAGAASEITWYTSDQPLSTQVFEKVEAYWPHDRGQLNGRPDFDGCWHHMMLFHLVNEMLLEIYDLSLPYYPNPLSHSCHVCPYPIGNHIIEEVTAKIGSLMKVETQEEGSLDFIVGHDLANDRSWMNLQFESECMVLELEDVIFNEILEEIIFSN